MSLLSLLLVGGITWLLFMNIQDGGQVQFDVMLMVNWQIGSKCPGQSVHIQGWFSDKI